MKETDTVAWCDLHWTDKFTTNRRDGVWAYDGPWRPKSGRRQVRGRSITQFVHVTAASPRRCRHCRRNITAPMARRSPRSPRLVACKARIYWLATGSECKIYHFRIVRNAINFAEQTRARDGGGQRQKRTRIRTRGVRGIWMQIHTLTSWHRTRAPAKNKRCTRPASNRHQWRHLGRSSRVARRNRQPSCPFTFAI